MNNKKIQITLNLMTICLLIISTVSAITLKTVAVDGPSFDSSGQYNYLPATIKADETTYIGSVFPYVVEFTSVDEDSQITLIYSSSQYQTNTDWQYFDRSVESCRDPSCVYTSGDYVTTCEFLDSKNWVDCYVVGAMGSTEFSYDYRVDDNKYQYITKLYKLNGVPELSNLPDMDIEEDETPSTNWIDFYEFIYDFETLKTDLDYSIVSQTNLDLISCSIIGDRYLDCDKPTDNEFGYSDIIIEVEDTEGDYDSDTFRITVNSVNDEPVLDNIIDKDVDENEELTFSIVGSDEEGDSLSYSASGLPSGAFLNLDEFTWIPSFEQSGSYSIEFSVTDGSSFDTQFVDIDVDNLNRLPILDFIGDKNVSENSSLIFTLTSTDLDLETLTYSATGLPTGATLVSGAFEWTPSFTQSGSYSIVFSVTDGIDTVDETIDVTVRNVNVAPVLNNILDITVTEEDLVSIVSIGTDFDGDSLTYLYTSPLDSNGDWLTIIGDEGTYTVTVTASDGNLTDSQDVYITVEKLNRVPILDFIGDKNVNENSLLSFAISASDLDLDLITYSSSNLPSGATFLGGVFEWTPLFSDSGSYEINFTASDYISNDTETINILVSNLNRLPVFDVIGDKNVEENSSLVFNLDSTDLDLEALTYSATGLTTGATLVSGAFEWTPTFVQAGNYSVVFSVTDGTDTVNETIEITVSNLNRAPVLDNILDIVANENDLVVVLPLGTDLDLDVLIYTFTGVLNNTGEWLTTHDDSGLYNAIVTVSDGYLTDSQNITITVNTVNRLPVFDVIGDKNIEENSLLAFIINASDLDLETLTYSATGLPTGATLVSSAFEWTPTFVQNGNYTVTFQVTDGIDTVNETVQITVSNLNRLPLFDIIRDKNIEENSLLAFIINASDLDLETLTYSATGLPTGATLVSSAFEWTPTFVQAGNYSVVFTVTDGIDTVNETIEITVSNLNRLPVLDNILDIIVNENEVVTILPTGSDPDGDILSYSFNGLINTSGEWFTNYTDSGVYTTLITVSDGNLIVSQNVTITVNNVNIVPVIDSIKSSNINPIESDTVTYTANVSMLFDTPVVYTWYVKNSNDTVIYTEVNKSLTYTFDFNGSYVVILDLKDIDSSSINDSILVIVDDNNILGSFVTYDIVSGDEALNINFSASVVNGNAPYIYNWSLDNGTILSSLNSSDYLFSQDGVYNITLNIFDADGDIFTDIQEIIVLDTVPSVEVLSDLNVVIENESVTFETLAFAYDGIISYDWFINSNLVNNSENFTYTFLGNGSYDIVLNVTDLDGSISSDSKVIIVSDLTPTVNFEFNGSLLEGDVVTFNDLSDSYDSIVSWNWDFGDSSNSSGSYVNHTYISNGIYNVTLTVIDSDSSISNLSKLVTISNVDVSFDLVSNVTSGYEALSVMFDVTNITGNTPVFIEWNFDDLSNATGSNVNHTFDTFGIYNVSVNVLDVDFDNLTKNIIITVLDAFAPVVSHLNVSVDDFSMYVVDKVYTFSVNLTDNDVVSDYWIVFDDVNYSSSNITFDGIDSYLFDITGLEVGMHNYTWFAQDVQGNLVNSEIENYSIVRGDSNLSLMLNGIENNINIQEDENVTIIASSLNPDELMFLYINGSLVKNGTEMLVYEFTPIPGEYNISLSIAEGINYLLDSVDYTITLIQTTFYDFKIENLVMSNENSRVGTDVTASFDVKNVGNVDGSTIARLFVSGVEVDSLTVSNLLVNESRELSFVYNLPGYEVDNLEFSVVIDALAKETILVDNSLISYVDVLAIHDVMISQISIDKETIYLNDIVSVVANVSNLGDLSESFIVNLKIDNIVVDSENITLNSSLSSQVTFDWIADSKDYHNVLIETVLVNDVNLTNNVNSHIFKVWSVFDNVNLDFVNVGNFPSNDTLANSTFFVWVNIDNIAGIGNDFKNFKLSIVLDGLTIVDSQDGVNLDVVTLPSFDGDSSTSYWWEVSSGNVVRDMNVSVYAGDVSENLSISREVSIK